MAELHCVAVAEWEMGWRRSGREGGAGGQMAFHTPGIDFHFLDFHMFLFFTRPETGETPMKLTR